MDNTQYYIPCIPVDELIEANYDLRKRKIDEAPYLISTLISPLIYQMQRITGKKTIYPKEIVYLEAKHNKAKHPQYRKIMADGFNYNGIHYVRFGKSASQSKQGITVFVANYIYNELEKISMLDIDMYGKDVCISKYEAQRCLIFSTCTLLDIPIPNIVIVDEYKKVIPNQKIRYAEETELISTDGNKYKTRQIKDGYKDIGLSPFDGCGVHTRALGLAAQEAIGLDYRPIGLQIRLPFMKGYSVEFDFRQWYHEHGITEITDVLGKKHNVDDIDCLWNASMFKGLGYFKGEYGDNAIEEYFKVLKKYEYKLGISKYSHHINHINIMSRMNFQYLQCLNLINPKYVDHFDKIFNGIDDKYDVTDEENAGKIINIAKYSTNLLEKIIGGSKAHTLKFLGLKNSEEDEVASSYIKAVLINDVMLKDPAVKRMIKRKCQKTIDEMKLGKIYCSGFYHTVVGDIIGYLEYAAGLEPKGVLGYKQFYVNTIFKNGEKILSFRSPLVCPSEVNDVVAINDLDEKWFGHFRNQDVVMINMYDLSMPVQGGIKWRLSSLLETTK